MIAIPPVSRTLPQRWFSQCSKHSAGLSLITAAIVHWNTVYLDRAVRQLRAQGTTVPDDLLAHVAPLGWEHIGLPGDYVWTEANPAAPFGPLREVRSMLAEHLCLVVDLAPNH